MEKVQQRGFLESVFDAYIKLISDPFSVILLIYALLELYSIYNHTNDPVLTILIYVQGNKSTLGFIRNLVKLMVKVLTFITKFRDILVPQVFVWVPYVSKPEQRSLMASIFVSFAVLIVENYSPAYMLLVSQLWFLYNELEQNIHKTLIVCLSGLSLSLAISEHGGTN